jgi:hypothetical protein
MESSAVTAALKPSAVAVTITGFSALSFAVSLLGPDARSQARKALLSSTPEKMESC